MGRKAFFTEKQVFDAADELAAEGKEVSASALLERLGGGSYTTIYKSLRAWQESRPALADHSVSMDLPEPVQTAFLAAWKVAAGEAARTVVAVRERAAEEVRAANKQFQESLEQIGRMEAESEEDGIQIEALKATIAQLEDALLKSSNESAGHKATAEQLRHQVKSQEAQLERAHNEMDKERSEHNKEIQRITTAAETTQRKAAEEIASLKGSLTEVQKQSIELEKRLAESQSRQNESLRQIEKLEEASKANQQERDAAIKEAAELRGLIEGLKTQNADLLSKVTAKE